MELHGKRGCTAWSQDTIHVSCIQGLVEIPASETEIKPGHWGHCIKENHADNTDLEYDLEFRRGQSIHLMQ